MRQAGGLKEDAIRQALTLRNLRDLTQEDLSRLAGSFITKDAYVIVHPSYYLFFHAKPFSLSPDPSRNAGERFLSMEFPAANPLSRLMQESQRSEMEFLAQAARNRVPVVLLLPGGYPASKKYLYHGHAPDEFARYLNEVTQGSDSVFYIESVSVNSGRISRETREALVAFLEGIGAENVFFGGGYIGRCQEEFYRNISRVWADDRLAVIPELSSFSPDDISDSTAKMFLTPDYRLNPFAMNYYIRNGGLKSLRTRVNIRHMSELTNGN